ncbi:DNA-binding transcriptional regulator, XRE-family HTH domain [Anaerovirgula multivorans]|uniref:DNA-binding transcriptional regulator, XRE-family HTH domain n=1 Tax=Anaerovirgula multivorans TaxID=312168 RepID=A0A239FJ30_9FIRM|nr:helix-turn-helix transcriptional regulator [Anaerovirgula multivorans]SNS56232.1 DNA-binding transcriptional regulator, XRE-family HTH domain [Anaerovirgula multivorans]
MNTIGKRIKYLREKKKLTQKQLADATGVQRGNLSHYEKDKIKPSSDAIISLSQFFNVSCDWFLIGKTEKKGRKGKSDEEPLILRKLTDEEKKDVAKYADYLVWRRTQEEKEREQLDIIAEESDTYEEKKRRDS